MAQSEKDVWAIVEELPGKARDIWYQAFWEALSEAEGDLGTAAALAWKAFKRTQGKSGPLATGETTASGILTAAIRGETPEWIKLSGNAGIVPSHGFYPSLADRWVQKAVVSDWEKWGGDMAIHLETQEVGSEAWPTVGWIKELKSRPEGLWIRVEWTKRGLTAITRQGCGHLALKFILDETNRPVRLWQATLANLMDLREKRGESRRYQDREEPLCGAGRTLTVVNGGKRNSRRDWETEPAYSPNVKAGEGEETTKLRQFLDEIRDVLQLSGEATLTEVKRAVVALKEGQEKESHPSPRKPDLPRTPVSSAVMQTTIEKAIATGLLKPEQKRWAQTCANQDWGDFRTFLDLAVGSMPRPKKKRWSRLAFYRAILKWGLATKPEQK